MATHRRSIRSLAVILALSLSACSGLPKPIADPPAWDGEFYSASQHVPELENKPGVIQRENGKIIKGFAADSPLFSQGLWLTNRSAGCLYQQFIANCKEWVNPQSKCSIEMTPELAVLLQQILNHE